MVRWPRFFMGFADRKLARPVRLRRTYILVRPRGLGRPPASEPPPQPRERRVPSSNPSSNPEHEPSRRDPREQQRRIEELEHDGTRPIGPDERGDD